MKQIQEENKKWAPVDKEDAKKMKKEAKKWKQDAEKAAKKQEKNDLIAEEEA